MPRSGARMAVPGEGRTVLEGAGWELRGPNHYITSRRPSSPAPLTPRQAAAHRADPRDKSHLPSRQKVRGGTGGLSTGISPPHSLPTALSAAAAPQAPPPLVLPAPRKLGPRRLGPGKGPPPKDTERWVRPGGMSARHRPGCSGPREVRRQRGRAQGRGLGGRG